MNTLIHAVPQEIHEKIASAHADLLAGVLTQEEYEEIVKSCFVEIGA